MNWKLLALISADTYLLTRSLYTSKIDPEKLEKRRQLLEEVLGKDTTEKIVKCVKLIEGEALSGATSSVYKLAEKCKPIFET